MYPGVADGFPETKPMRRIPGLLGNDYFGYAVGLVGDLDGDGASEFLVRAMGAEEDGPDVGRNYFVWGSHGPDIPFGSTWSYNQDGEDLGLIWTTLDYDDSSWPTGAAEFGYGEGDEVTELQSEGAPTTIYFRKKLVIPGPVGQYWMRFRIDDGLAVFVNGELVTTFNVNGDEAGLAFDAPATASADNKWVFVKSGPDDPNPFVAGENVIAVMVKQSNKPGGDMTFNLELELFASADPAVGGAR